MGLVPVDRQVKVKVRIYLSKYTVKKISAFPVLAGYVTYLAGNNYSRLKTANLFFTVYIVVLVSVLLLFVL